MVMQTQKDFWRENGYLTFDGVLSPEEVEAYRRSAESLLARAAGLTESSSRFKFKFLGSGGGKVVQQISEPSEMAAEWMALARDPRILDVVEALLGPNIQFYYSMLMVKPPREGYEAGWHQDMAHFVHNRADLLAVQFYIDDSTLENGCIRVVPGSHRLGLLNHFNSDGTFNGVVQGDRATYDAQAVALEVKAGGMALWNALTLHASSANRSEKPRRAITFEYKNPAATLLAGSFNPRQEVRPVGVMLRGVDPRGELLSAI